MDQETTNKVHAPNYGTYVLVWLSLLTLTAATTIFAGINFGAFTITLALIIACTKSYLVLTEFMHLKTESKAFKIFVVVAILFLVICLVLLFSDYSNM